MADSMYSFSLTTFSPSGKLVQIEYALNAVSAGATALGIKGTSPHTCLVAAGSGGWFRRTGQRGRGHRTFMTARRDPPAAGLFATCSDSARWAFAGG